MRRVRMQRLAEAMLTVALATGCTTLQFTVGSGPAGRIVEEKRNDSVFTLATERVESVSERCPNGALRITETTTPVDAVSTLFTLGLWWPRTIIYECRGEVTG